MKVLPQKTQFEVKISRGDSLEPGLGVQCGFLPSGLPSWWGERGQPTLCRVRHGLAAY